MEGQEQNNVSSKSVQNLKTQGELTKPMTLAILEIRFLNLQSNSVDIEVLSGGSNLKVSMGKYEAESNY